MKVKQTVHVKNVGKKWQQHRYGVQ